MEDGGADAPVECGNGMLPVGLSIGPDELILQLSGDEAEAALDREFVVVEEDEAVEFARVHEGDVSLLRRVSHDTSKGPRAGDAGSDGFGASQGGACENEIDFGSEGFDECMNALGVIHEVTAKFDIVR